MSDRGALVLRRLWVATACAAALLLSACGVRPDSIVQGQITVDGSTALYPFNLKVEQAFYKLTNDPDSSIEHSGDSNALRRLCAGEISIAGVARPATDREKAACSRRGITLHRILIARQAAVVVANKGLGVDCLTTEQLHALWRRGSKVKSYSQLESDLPATDVALYGPTTGAAVYGLFNAAINGRATNSRSDYQSFVFPKGPQFARAVASDPAGLGYFDYAWLKKSLGSLQVVGVDSGDGCVLPSNSTIQDGSYSPLSRPFYYYFKLQPLTASSPVDEFLQVALANAKTFAKNHYVVPITPAELTAARVEWLNAIRAQQRQSEEQ